MSRKNKIEIPAELGKRVREIRRTKKITLIELSKLTGVAQATLSRMECGLMLGTVKSHQKIAEVLGVSLAQLYEGIDSRQSDVKHQQAATERKITFKAERVKCELLTHEATKKKITPLLITLQSSGKTESEQSERGVEKFLLVLEGISEVTLDQAKYTLQPFDTLYFDASIRHQIANTGSKPAKIFCAVSPSKI